MGNNDQPNQTLKTKKVFDVMRPGAAPASATSRPIIPSRTRVTDPDVSLQRRLKPVDAKEKVHLEPLRDDSAVSFDSETQTGNDASRPEFAENTAVSSLVEQANDPTKTESLESANTSATEPSDEIQPNQPETATEPAAMTDEAAEKTTPDKTKDAENLGQATLDNIFGESESQLVDPMKSAPRGKQQRGDNGAIIAQHSHTRRSLTEVFLWLLIIVVIMAIVNFLLDAGIFGTEWNVPHTDFFGD